MATFRMTWTETVIMEADLEGDNPNHAFEKYLEASPGEERDSLIKNISTMVMDDEVSDFTVVEPLDPNDPYRPPIYNTRWEENERIVVSGYDKELDVDSIDSYPDFDVICGKIYND